MDTNKLASDYATNVVETARIAAEDAVIDRCRELAIARRRLKTLGGDQ